MQGFVVNDQVIRGVGAMVQACAGLQKGTREGRGGGVLAESQFGFTGYYVSELGKFDVKRLGEYTISAGALTIGSLRGARVQNPGGDISRMPVASSELSEQKGFDYTGNLVIIPPGAVVLNGRYAGFSGFDPDINEVIAYFDVFLRQRLADGWNIDDLTKYCAAAPEALYDPRYSGPVEKSEEEIALLAVLNSRQALRIAVESWRKLFPGRSSTIVGGAETAFEK